MAKQKGHYVFIPKVRFINADPNKERSVQAVPVYSLKNSKKIDAYLCPECQGRVEDGDNYCRHCGYKLSFPKFIETKQPVKPEIKESKEEKKPIVKEQKPAVTTTVPKKEEKKAQPIKQEEKTVEPVKKEGTVLESKPKVEQKQEIKQDFVTGLFR